jgi:DNA segregation ATPase FtsK/SpoIIIE-like protein
MSRKTSSDNANGFGDVIGVALLAAALLLLIAQLSFDRNDISFLTTKVNPSAHNWIKLPGAYLAWISFLLLGITGYLLPWLLAIFGVAYLLNFLGYLRERLRWSLLWAGVLLMSLTGLLYIMDNAGWLGKIHERIGSQSAGGWLGYATYGQTPHYEYGFCLLGGIGATIIYATLVLISLLFLTNFRLGDWIRAFIDKEPAKTKYKTLEELALERRAAIWKSRRRNCRRKSRALASARTGSRFPNQPSAI